MKTVLRSVAGINSMREESPDSVGHSTSEIEAVGNSRVRQKKITA